MNGIELYNKVKTPPDGAWKPIKGGPLAGKTEINPQWRIQIMTEVYGPCGVGWKFDITNKETITCPEGNMLLYVEVALYFVDKEKGQWSEPIYGWGGDFIIEKNKNGLVANDEAYKMALTDALGNAMKFLGVGADVYMGKFDKKKEKPESDGPSYDGSKYSKEDYSARRETGPAQKAQQVSPPQQQAASTERRNEHGELLISTAQQRRMFALAGRNAEIVKDVIMRHGYVKTADITRHDYNGICSEIEDMAKAGD